MYIYHLTSYIDPHTTSFVNDTQYLVPQSARTVTKEDYRASKASVTRRNLNRNRAKPKQAISLRPVEHRRAQFQEDLSKIRALRDFYFLVSGNIIDYPLPNQLLLLIGYTYNVEKPLNILINYSVIYFRQNLIILQQLEGVVKFNLQSLIKSYQKIKILYFYPKYTPLDN